MTDGLTKQEVELIYTFADMDMRIKATASTMHYDRKTIFLKLTQIHQKTGYNPREFWDLYMLIKELLKEDADARENEVRSEQDRSDDG